MTETGPRDEIADLLCQIIQYEVFEEKERSWLFLLCSLMILSKRSDVCEGMSMDNDEESETESSLDALTSLLNGTISSEIEIRHCARKNMNLKRMSDFKQHPRKSTSLQSTGP
jgi:hypothetical protein